MDHTPLPPTQPHILFVDDEAPIRELLSLFFRKKGLQVTTATNSEQAKHLSLTTGFDLLILDLHLADENGLDLLDHFKDTCPELPVVIFTGMGANLDSKDRMRAAGADAFMCKTEPLAVLFAQVMQVLAQAHARSVPSGPRPQPRTYPGL